MPSFRGSLGSGDGTVTFSVDRYAGHARARSGVITVGTETFLIQQSR